MFGKTWKLKGAIDKKLGGAAAGNLIVLGDLNTMGMMFQKPTTRNERGDAPTEPVRPLPREPRRPSPALDAAPTATEPTGPRRPLRREERQNGGENDAAPETWAGRCTR